MQAAGKERRQRAAGKRGAARDLEAEVLVGAAGDSETDEGEEAEEEEEERRQADTRRARPAAGNNAGGKGAKKPSKRPPGVQRDAAEDEAQCIKADAEAEMLRVHEMIEAELASVAEQQPPGRAGRPAKTKKKSSRR